MSLALRQVSSALAARRREVAARRREVAAMFCSKVSNVSNCFGNSFGDLRGTGSRGACSFGIGKGRGWRKGGTCIKI